MTQKTRTGRYDINDAFLADQIYTDGLQLGQKCASQAQLGSLSAADLQLAQSGFHRDFADDIALTQQTLALPDMGRIRTGPRRVRETFFPAVARPVDEASAER